MLRKPQEAACHSENFEEEELGTLTTSWLVTVPFFLQGCGEGLSNAGPPEPHPGSQRALCTCTVGASDLLEKAPAQKLQGLLRGDHIVEDVRYFYRNKLM